MNIGPVYLAIFGYSAFPASSGSVRLLRLVGPVVCLVTYISPIVFALLMRLKARTSDLAQKHNVYVPVRGGTVI